MIDWRAFNAVLALNSLSSDEPSLHRNPLRAKGVVILDTGHHLTSNPTDIQGTDEINANSFFSFGQL